MTTKRASHQIIPDGRDLTGGSPASSDEESETFFSRARGRSLMDDSDESPTPVKKRARLSTSAAVSTSWQQFCRKGTRLKTLFGDAVSKASEVGTAQETGSTLESRKHRELSQEGGSTLPHQSTSALSDLAREKTAQCIILKQELAQSRSEKSHLKALNDELRETARQQARRMQKATHALQVATQNAATARQDADAAEVTSETLASQLESLQVVVEETKRASQVLLEEQREVSQKAQIVEHKYVQAAAELARSRMQQLQLQQTNRELEDSVQRLKRQIGELHSTLEHQHDEENQWKQNHLELKAVEASTNERLVRLSQELLDAQAQLVDATATASESESTSAHLKQSLEQLQQANEQLHARLEDQNKTWRRESESRQDALNKAQQQVQTLKLQVTKSDDQIQKVLLEKKTQERRSEQLQNKVSNLERRLQESTNLVSSVRTPESSKTFDIPPLGKENNLPSCKCAICFKDAVGVMKKCQCGKKGCDARAHTKCVNKIKAGPSVSHPGTPAPRLPIILCSNKSTAITPIALPVETPSK